MPKTGVHYIIIDEAIARLRQSASSAAQERGQLLDEQRFFAGLGAIGPDLFFWGTDYALTQKLRPFIPIWGRLKDYEASIEETYEGIKGQLEEHIDAVVSELEDVPILGEVLSAAEAIKRIHEEFSSLQDELDHLGDEIEKTLFIEGLGLRSEYHPLGSVIRGFTQRQFQPGVQVGEEEADWYWMDMLHYRLTGTFARNLVKNAEASGDDRLRAYAYGYLSHIAGDVVGHPYVNSVCRNVFRANILLHAAAEQFIDQWAWNQAYDKNVRVDLFRRMGFDDQPEIPAELAALLRKTLVNTYHDQAHPLRQNAEHPFEAPPDAQEMPGFPSEKDLQDAYKATREFVRLSGNGTEIRPEEPYEGADEDLSDLKVALGLDQRPSLPLTPDILIEELMEGIPDAEFDAWMARLEGMLVSLADAFRDQIRSSREIVEVLDEIVGIPDTSVEAVLLILYWWRREVYSAYLRLNLLLALTGLFAPEPEWARLDHSVGRRLILPNHCWTDQDNHYPPLREPGSPYLACPEFLFGIEGEAQVQQFERPSTWVGPYLDISNDTEATPDLFIRSAPFQEFNLHAYAAAETPQRTHELHDKGLAIGNAVEFTAWMIANADHQASDSDPIQNAVFCNWNLDGDRGYGYKCWEGLIPDSNLTGSRLILRYSGADFFDVDPAHPNLPRSYFPFVWHGFNGDYESLGNERYVDEKTFDESFAASIRVCEDSSLIPKKYQEIDPAVSVDEWIALLPSRLRVTGNSLQQNIRYVNGVSTSAYTAPLEVLLFTNWFERLRQLYGRSSPAAAVELVYNRTHRTLGVVGDFLQAARDRTEADILAEDWLSGGLNWKPEVTNATTLSLIAQLFQAMDEQRPMFLVGYSQGTLIVSSALLAFARLGQDHKAFLDDNVRVLCLAQVASSNTAAALSDLFGENYRHYERPNDLLVQLISQYLPPHDIDQLLDPWWHINQRLSYAQLFSQGPGQLLTLMQGLGESGDLGLEAMDTVFGPHLPHGYLDLVGLQVENNAPGIRPFLFG